jgi:AraC-like DNA-binding protein
MSPFPPIRTDLFSMFIFLGVIQGFFLSYFFIANSRGSRFSNLFLGALLLSLSVVMTDVWLGYTNYMFRVLWLVDFSEPINLLLAPLTFLYIKSGVTKRFKKIELLHFLPTVLYLIYMCLLIYPQSIEFKYNANVGAFHPEMKTVDGNEYGQRWMFFLKWHINDFTFISMLIYDVLGFVVLNNAFTKKGLSFFTRETTPLTWYRKLFLELLLLVIVFFLARAIFPRDLGDHIISACISLIIYLTSISVFKSSVFFQQAGDGVVKKYEKSSLTTEIQDATLEKLDQLMKTEKPFMDAGFSLPILAKRLGISTHHLSQILNEELGQTFFDFLASYRIGEAQKLLASGEHHYIKIEEIAQMVGYNSKSAFNTSFRKITGFTPSEFKRQSVK